MAVRRRFPTSGGNSDFATGIKWVGAETEWKEDSRFELSTDEFGANVLVREYNMRRDVTLQPKLPNKGDYDFQFTNLLVYDFTVRGDGPWLRMTVRFNGFLNGPRSTPLIREMKQSLIRTQTVYASQVISGRRINFGRSLNLEYIAPSVVRRYSLPSEPKFKDRYEDPTFRENVRITNIVVGDSGVLINPDDFKSVMAYYDLRKQQRSIRTQLQVDPVGAVFNVTEVIERRIIQQPSWDTMKF